MLLSRIIQDTSLTFADHLVVVCIALRSNGDSSYRDASNVGRLMSNKSNNCDIHILTDSPQDVKHDIDRVSIHTITTRSEFIMVAERILNHVPSKSNLLLTISSHGYICRTNNRLKEKSGFSEYIKVGGEKVFDYELSHILVHNVAPTCTVFVVADTCHSGTLIDLHYTSIDGKNFQRTKYTYGNNRCRCLMVSACSDTETAGEDISHYAGWGGKLMCNFLDYVENHSTINWVDWFLHVRHIFVHQTSQKSHPILSIL